ncbi:VgrG-related protein [Collinsella aerofaciens]|uniref:VgrG-related protein n=1 Tax=Collinsella aerofaciens TaxID=74426 RepID=UPI00359C3774
MQPKHSAIVAGLTLALSFGAVAAPATAIAEEPTPGVASDATDIDKGLYTQQSFSGVLRSVQGVSFVNVTAEMKYFTKYESHGNYNQGFSYGDGYNALGYYQFDRRWSLIPFMKQVYNYDSAKYGMLKAAIDRGSEISNGSNPMYANGQLTELGHIAQDAFLGAYNTDPVEFSALQDAYAYNSYYAVTESWLKNALGIDISGRADCVKGMVWSTTNMCGTGGCQDFFRWANLSNDMTDREFVTALSNSVVDNVARKYSSQPQYHEGWKNRYKNELKDCLVYIAEDEAAAAAPAEPEPAPAPHPNKVPAAPAGPTVETDSDTDNGGETGAPSTGVGNNGAGNSGTASGGTESAGGAGDSGSGSTGGSVSGPIDSGSSNGSTDVGESSGTDSDSTADPDVSNSSTENKPSVGKQLGALIGSSMTGINGGSSSDEGASEQGSGSNVDSAADASADAGAKQSDADAQKVDDKNVTSTTTTTTTTTTTKAPGGNMPKTGDLIVMASLASASLATLGATSIVSGKHKLDQQKKAAGENGSEE